MLTSDDPQRKHICHIWKTAFSGRLFDAADFGNWTISVNRSGQSSRTFNILIGKNCVGSSRNSNGTATNTLGQCDRSLLLSADEARFINAHGRPAFVTACHQSLWSPQSRAGTWVCSA